MHILHAYTTPFLSHRYPKVAPSPMRESKATNGTRGLQTKLHCQQSTSIRLSFPARDEVPLHCILGSDAPLAKVALLPTLPYPQPTKAILAPYMKGAASSPPRWRCPLLQDVRPAAGSQKKSQHANGNVQIEYIAEYHVCAGERITYLHIAYPPTAPFTHAPRQPPPVHPLTPYRRPVTVGGIVCFSFLFGLSGTFCWQAPNQPAQIHSVVSTREAGYAHRVSDISSPGGGDESVKTGDSSPPFEALPSSFSVPFVRELNIGVPHLEKIFATVGTLANRPTAPQAAATRPFHKKKKLRVCCGGPRDAPSHMGRLDPWAALPKKETWVLLTPSWPFTARTLPSQMMCASTRCWWLAWGGRDSTDERDRQEKFSSFLRRVLFFLFTKKTRSSVYVDCLGPICLWRWQNTIAIYISSYVLPPAL